VRVGSRWLPIRKGNQRAARLEVRRNFISNRVVDSWNQLPSEVKNVEL
jgi:hypothetical protein